MVSIFEGSLPRKSFKEMDKFRKEAEAFQQDLTATNIALSKSSQKVAAMLRALNKATAPSNDLFKKLNSTKIMILDIEKELYGNSIKDEIGERSNPTASEGNSISWRALGNTYGPTGEHKNFLSRVQSQLKKVKAKLIPILNTTIPELENELKKQEHLG